MTRHRIDLVGMPYVPGSAHGLLARAGSSDVAGRIAVLVWGDAVPSARPRGLIVVDGAPLSHRMIRVLGAGVPTVLVGFRQAALLREGTEVRIDGATGRITTDPGEEAWSREPPPAAALGVPVLTTDGTPVNLRASVRDAESARIAVVSGAQAIGLVRSELLQPEDGKVPDPSYYGSALGAICRAAYPLGVTVRLLDVAADKTPPWLAPCDAVGGTLGLQGVRLYATEPARRVLHAQLSAIDRLADRFEVRLLIPFVSRLEELAHWSAAIRARLSRPLELGAMVESPAGALDLASWLGTADFAALGCNDLMQCLFAADRERPTLRDYLDPYAPVLFRFLRQVAVACAAHLGRIQLCGVLPQLQAVLPILLGLGYRSFSVEARLIPHLRQSIRATAVPDAEVLAARVCTARLSREVLEVLGLNLGAYRPYLPP